MKLELSSKEVQAILLEYAEQKWPGAFNTVNGDNTYSQVSGATFTKTEPELPEALEAE